MRPPVLVVLLALALTATTADAIGLCENTPRRYGVPRFIHADDLTLAIPASQAWCEETADGGERRGTLWFVEQRDTEMNEPAILTTSRAALARLQQLFTSVVHVANIDQALRKSGYRRMVPRTRTCTVRTSFQPAQETQHGFPAGTLAVHVVAGGKRLASAELGLIATARRSEVAIAADFTPGKVVVFARMPTCSGPPPGTFGPDDAGDCYANDEIEIHVFDTTGLAACFAK